MSNFITKNFLIRNKHNEDEYPVEALIISDEIARTYTVEFSGSCTNSAEDE